MEGVVDWIVRDLLTDIGGLDRTVTEFIRVTDRLLPDHVFHRYCPELLNGGRTRSGIPVFVQLLGGQPDWLACNAKAVEALGAPGIDLNFGCPAKTVNRHDGGATLLQNPQRLYDIISAVKSAVSVPVTAKVRLGFENKDLHLDIARAVDAAGAASLTIHARTKKEGYVAPAHWEYIAKMKDVVKLQVIANGEIWTRADYDRCVQISGLRDVALGRGLVSCPDLAMQIRESSHQALPWSEVMPRYLEPFFKLSVAERGEPYAVARMKQLLKFVSRTYLEASELFETIKTFTTVAQIRPFIEIEFIKIKTEEECRKLKFTPGPTAPTAFEPRIC
jgi:tRNA-dihydrouridine synthase C